MFTLSEMCRIDNEYARDDRAQRLGVAAQRETVLMLADVMGSAHKAAAESVAAALPPAPRCPL